MHVNSKVYNYSESKISKQSGLSRTAVKKYIDFYISNGWAKIKGKDLVFISTNKLKYKYGIGQHGNISLPFKSKIIELVKILRYELFKNKQRKFIYLKTLRNNLTNPTNLLEYKRAKSKLKSKNTEGEVSTGLKISTRKLGIVINKSASTASRLIKEMGATVITGKKIIARFDRKVELPTNLFQYKGFILKSECNQYIF
jgi:hypothetical protein